MGVRNKLVKKISLLVIVCLSIFIWNYTRNTNFVSADDNHYSSKIEKKNKKATNKVEKKNKNEDTQKNSSDDLIKILPIFITGITFLGTFLYYVCESLSLNDSEKKLLKLKDNFLDQLALPAIMSIEFILCIYLYLKTGTKLSRSDSSFLISFILALPLIIILYLYISFTSSNVVRVIIDYKDYEFLHRIDDNRFSARSWGDKESIKTYIFPTSVLDNNFLLLEPKKTKMGQRIIISILVVAATTILIFSLLQLFLSSTYSFYTAIILGLIYFVFMCRVYVRQPKHTKY